MLRKRLLARPHLIALVHEHGRTAFGAEADYCGRHRGSALKPCPSVSCVRSVPSGRTAKS